MVILYIVTLTQNLKLKTNKKTLVYSHVPSLGQGSHGSFQAWPTEQQHCFLVRSVASEFSHTYWYGGVVELKMVM